GLGDRGERARIDEERRVRAGGAQLRVGGGDEDALRAGRGRRRHGRAEGEDVIARGDVAVSAVVEERLRGAAADRGEVGGDGDVRVARAGACLRGGDVGQQDFAGRGGHVDRAGGVGSR